MSAAAVSEATFAREVLGAAIPVLVEFSAARVPSNAALDTLSSELDGRVKVTRVDVDQDPSLKDEYAVRGLPALILFKYGKPVARTVGLLSISRLREWIDDALILALATARVSAARPVTNFTLANGLEVVVIPDHRAPVVTQMVWYRVGSVDDPKDFSGLAQLLAYLTLKSLDKITDGDFSNTISRIGGETNAVCYRDATLFWQRVPKEHLKMVMELEVDRMSNLRVTEGDVTTERGAILEQRRSALASDPGARLVEEMNAMLYRRAHPYGLPATSAPGQVARLSLDDLLRFHKLHYAPNKAVLVVSGDVTPDKVESHAQETFGRIPANPNVARRPPLRAPLHVEARRVELEDPRSETARFYRTYAVPGYASAAQGELEALDVLAKILSLGVASRLYRKLVIEEKVASSVFGSHNSMVEAGELTLMILTSDAGLGAVEAGVDEVIEEIRKNGVTPDELVAAKRLLVANYIYRGADQFDLAHRYGWAVALGVPMRDPEGRSTAISRVSAADVARVATKYFIERRTVTGRLSCRRGGKSAGRPQLRNAERRCI